MDYPDQIDVVWLASDSAGQLAAMVTAGEGPIPATVLAVSSCIANEEALLSLPVLGEALLKVRLPDPTSFAELSRRGLFVYDWTDVHRTNACALESYELMCSPTVRLSREDLPLELLALTYRVKATFGDTFIPPVFEYAG